LCAEAGQDLCLIGYAAVQAEKCVLKLLNEILAVTLRGMRMDHPMIVKEMRRLPQHGQLGGIDGTVFNAAVPNLDVQGARVVCTRLTDPVLLMGGAEKKNGPPKICLLAPRL